MKLKNITGKLVLLTASMCSLVLQSANVNNAEIKVVDNKISVSPFMYKVDGKELKSPGRIFNIVPTQIKNMTVDVTLKSSYRDNIWVYMSGKLPARNIVEFKLTDKQGNILEEGVDYRLNRKGAISRVKDKNNPTNAKPISTTAYFTYLPERYDSVFLNTSDGSLTLAKGTVRDVDAEEYVPAIPAGTTRLCNIAVTGENILIVPAYEKKNAIVAGDLSGFYKKLKSGKPIKVLGYGDSITAVQTGTPGYQPNAKAHDQYKRYLDRYPKDTVNLVTKYDFNDGLGKKHCKIGWNWALVEAIEKKYGNKVEYLNCGIGGTRSDASKKQGLFPERINAALAARPDLVVIAFGMNELGSNRTGKNIDAIIKRFKETGSDVIVMGVPQINGSRGTKSWQKTNDILKKVAADNNCPFVDTTQINLEIAPEHICSANQYNHPGISELKKYGEALASILK